MTRDFHRRTNQMWCDFDEAGRLQTQPDKTEPSLSVPFTLHVYNLTVTAGGGAVTGEKAGKPVTTVQDCVITQLTYYDSPPDFERLRVPDQN